MSDFDIFLEALTDDDFEEKPVDLKTFVEGKDFLGLPPLSDIQYTLVEKSTQIYRKETLQELYGELEGAEFYEDYTVNEVIAQLGKGSGKDYCSTISVARIVYLLLCLKDPAAYFGKPPGDSIDILNIAINADQAKNVFFKGFKTRIEKSPWFIGKYHPTANAIEFDKSITCYSGHSERESWEGYNVLCVILDEISGFALESSSGNAQAKTAQQIYDMYSGSVTSRFPETGKTILLSFPRFKGDFIQSRYEKVIEKKETTTERIRLKIMDDLPDEIEDNWFTIEWEHDEIVAYNTPRVYAIKRATWEVNPTWSLNAAKPKFIADIVDSLSRFACMPPEAVDAFFKDKAKVEAAFVLTNPAYEDWRLYDTFRPEPEKIYYIHVDLAHKHDHAAVAMAHVDKWVNLKIGDYQEAQPLVKVDIVRYWTPKPDKEIDFQEIRDFIINLRRRGFPIGLVTFDRWNSIDTIKFLQDNGMEAERLSVDKRHYEDLMMLVQEERVKGPNLPILLDELLGLKIMKGNKVDHPRKGSKDLADATTGACYNAVAYTDRPTGEKIIEVHNLESISREQTNFRLEEQRKSGVIVAPSARREIPNDVDDFLSRLRVL